MIAASIGLFAQSARMANHNNVAPIQSSSLATGALNKTMASGDTLMLYTVTDLFVNPTDSAAFSLAVEDVDGLTPNAQSIQVTSYGAFYSTEPNDIDASQGDVDTALFLLATSWFTAPGQADNWFIAGPITIPAAGADLTWKDRIFDLNFKDGYEVRLSTTGGTSADFTSPAVYTIADNAAGLDTIWSARSYTIDGATFGGQQVYVAFRHTANDQYIFGLDKIMMTESTGAVLTFDDCGGATDINSGFGQALGVEQVLGPYDNSAATTGPADPASGWECFGEPDGTAAAPELNNTVWFTFTGDGNNYFVESGNCAGITNYIDDGDTQFALYSGSCNNLTPIKCNEDGPNATATTYPAGLSFGTTAGTTYYLMVDGFNATALGGTVSAGEFCLKVTQQQAIACGAPSITFGTLTQTTDTVCPGDSIIVTSTGAISPNTGQYSGLGWVISNADITGTTDPLNTTTFVASYGFQSPVPATSTRKLVNDGTLIGGPVPYGVYYWTPVVFANATSSIVNPVFLSDLTLDPSCTVAGQSLMALFADPADPACLVGFNELNGKDFNITEVFPVPVKEMLNFNINAKNATDINVSVKDIVGREVYSNTNRVNSGLNKVSIPMTKYSSGVYTITVVNGKNVATSKFVKQ